MDIRETVNLLSPVVLLKEVENLTRNLGEKYFFISEWYKHKDHKQIFWNIVYYFNVLGLPTYVLTYINDELIMRDIMDNLKKQMNQTICLKNESFYNKVFLNLNLITSNLGLKERNEFEKFSTDSDKLTLSSGWDIVYFKM